MELTELVDGWVKSHESHFFRQNLWLLLDTKKRYIASHWLWNALSDFGTSVLSSLLWHDRTAIDVHLWKLRSLKAECYRNFSRDGWDVRTNLTRFFESTFDISHTSSYSGWWKPGVSSSYVCLSWTPSPRKGRPPETAKLCQRKRLAQSSRRDTTLTSQRNHGHLLDVYIYLRLTTVDRQISTPVKIYINSQHFNPMNWPQSIHRIFVCLSCSPTSSWNWPAW